MRAPHRTPDRLAARAVVAAVALVVLASACSSSTDEPAATPRPAAATALATSAPSTSATSTPSTPSTSTTSTTARVRSAVGSIRHVIHDATRGRRLDTLVHYPARVDGSATPALPGPFPLVLMAHGYRLPADGYDRVLMALVGRGYVVAAPDFPHTTGNGGDGNRADIVNQPGDLVAVLDAITGGQVPGLPAIAHPDRVAVMGHSDGGLTTSAIAYNTRYRDPRVAAAVVMTGGRSLFPGSYFAPGSPPLLALHGTADETNGIGGSINLFRDLPAGIPGYLVRIEGGSHLGPFMFDTGMPALGDLIAHFLDAHLGPVPDPGAAARLRRDGARPPLSIDAC